MLLECARMRAIGSIRNMHPVAWTKGKMEQWSSDLAPRIPGIGLGVFFFCFFFRGSTPAKEDQTSTNLKEQLAVPRNLPFVQLVTHRPPALARSA